MGVSSLIQWNSFLPNTVGYPNFFSFPSPEVLKLKFEIRAGLELPPYFQQVVIPGGSWITISNHIGAFNGLIPCPRARVGDLGTRDRESMLALAICSNHWPEGLLNILFSKKVAGGPGYFSPP